MGIDLYAVRKKVITAFNAPDRIIEDVLASTGCGDQKLVTGGKTIIDRLVFEREINVQCLREFVAGFAAFRDDDASQVFWRYPVVRHAID